MCATAKASTIINVPIDSRPVSDDYLGRLAEMGGDEYIAVSKENMDYFPADSSKSRFGNSKKVREELKELVSGHNNEDTSVIISTTTYITNGLVGSRCGSNYADYKEALSDLKELAQSCDKPRYYVYMPMPRALPETRLNSVWCDDDKYKGLAAFYLEANPDCDKAEDIKNGYEYVTPSQLLMEYGYVENKALERGGNKYLESWELSFLKYFKQSYLNNDKYSDYINDYILPYKATADIFDTLLEYKQSGLIDEILVGNDDLQLPSSLVYLSSLGLVDLSFNGSIPKYSFARSYMQGRTNSVEASLQKTVGVKEKALALLGRNDSINIIRGADELPQLIYARDYTRRKNITPKYRLVFNTLTAGVDEFDVITPVEIARAATNYACANVGKYTEKSFDMYIFDYADFWSSESIMKEMGKSVKAGNDVGLVELLDMSHPTNSIYKNMIASGGNIDIKDISVYSAWNTNANAIGLGVAQAQVWAVAAATTDNPSSTFKLSSELLAQHCLEDGEYTAHGKLTLVNNSYVPKVGDSDECEALRSTLNEEAVLSALTGKECKIDGEELVLDNIKLEKATLPWERTFDCYVQAEAEIGTVTK
jgi:hypothetical protein